MSAKNGSNSTGENTLGHLWNETIGLPSRIIYRFHQGVFALSAMMDDFDWQFVNSYLNVAEMALFKQLPEYEQKHAVETAKKMLLLGHGRIDLEERKLARIGLLHDVGKAAIRLSVLDKSYMVVLKKFLPWAYWGFATLGKKEKSWRPFRKIYVHRMHEKIGARLLARAGAESDVIAAIASHGEKFHKDDLVYARLLKEADGQY